FCAKRSSTRWKLRIPPKPIFESALGTLQPITLNSNNPTVLTGNGDGKDSFLSMKVLEEANIPFAAL
ncbi:MAG: hypothetical protein LH679_01575, partial [Cyanobacteria bacterium CAN_BIN43]|nr:hypothetical protein [Cyanobacteria bacterium CAN_BIN43]